LSARVTAIVREAGARNPARLAGTVSLLNGGGIVAAHAIRSTVSADRARAASPGPLKQVIG
jgi:hypothetical protein